MNGVVVSEAIDLESTLISNNPIIGQDQMQLSYSSIVSGVYQGVKARVGPGHWNDLTDIFNNSGSAKILKSPTQTIDYAYTLTFSSGDVAALGANIAILMVLVNKQVWPATIVFSNYPVTAGNTAVVSGLETLANTTSLDILLG